MSYSEEQLKKKLNKYMKMPSETEWLEFKEAKNSYDFNKLGKYFSALSNEANLNDRDCSWLIFGVTDKKEVVGTDYRRSRESLDKLKYEIACQTNGISFQEIYELFVDKKRVLMFQIPSAPAGIPTTWQRHWYGRNGESLDALSVYKLEKIRNQIQYDWSAGICEKASIDDLDSTALTFAKTKFVNKHKRNKINIENWNNETFLEKTQLTRNQQITRTAILLLGKPESAHHLTPHPVQITWKLSTEEKAYEHFGPPFLLTVEDMFKRIRNTKLRIQPFNQLIPIELEKYNSEIILEALNNCIVHQDYNKNARIVVTEKIDKIILENIGDFYDGTLEDYILRERTPKCYRNPFLAQAMYQLDMIDTMGSGIKRMFEEQRRRYFPLPEYDLNEHDNIKLTIFGQIIDETYSRILIEKKDLLLSEVILLDKVQKKKKLSGEEIKQLRKKGLIEGKRNNIYLSAQVSDVLDKKVTYIKNKAFDRSKYEKWILEYLDKYSEASSQDLQVLLIDMLSKNLTIKQKKDQIRNLLQLLSKKGVICNKGGNGRYACWVKTQAKK